MIAQLVEGEDRDVFEGWEYVGYGPFGISGGIDRMAVWVLVMVMVLVLSFGRLTDITCMTCVICVRLPCACK
jgi:hypothetical protein